MSTPFRPHPAATASIAVTTSSQAVQVSFGVGDRQIRVVNNSGATVFIEAGNSAAITANTTTSMPVLNGVDEMLSFSGPVYIAAIATGSPTGSIYFTPGFGV